MARNYKELQEKMDPAIRSDNRQRVRDELQRMGAKAFLGRADDQWFPVTSTCHTARPALVPEQRAGAALKCPLCGSSAQGHRWHLLSLQWPQY